LRFKLLGHNGLRVSEMCLRTWMRSSSGGITSGEDPEREQALIDSYAAVGVTWWLENFMPQRWGGSWSDWPLEQMHHRVCKGPPSSLR
jgi:hypothetical protein